MTDNWILPLAIVIWVLIGLMMIFKPRLVWKFLEERPYRNFDEPSEGGYLVRQFVGLVVVILAVATLIINGLQGTAEPDTSALRPPRYVPDDAAVSPNTIAPGETDRLVVGNIGVPNQGGVEPTLRLYVTVTDANATLIDWQRLVVAVPPDSTREFSPTAAFQLKDLPDGEYHWSVALAEASETPISSGTFTVGPGRK